MSFDHSGLLSLYTNTVSAVSGSPALRLVAARPMIYRPRLTSGGSQVAFDWHLDITEHVPPGDTWVRCTDATVVETLRGWFKTVGQRLTHQAWNQTSDVSRLDPGRPLALDTFTHDTFITSLNVTIALLQSDVAACRSFVPGYYVQWFPPQVDTEARHRAPPAHAGTGSTQTQMQSSRAEYQTTNAADWSNTQTPTGAAGPSSRAARGL